MPHFQTSKLGSVQKAFQLFLRISPLKEPRAVIISNSILDDNIKLIMFTLSLTFVYYFKV